MSMKKQITSSPEAQLRRVDPEDRVVNKSFLCKICKRRGNVLMSRLYYMKIWKNSSSNQVCVECQ